MVLTDIGKEKMEAIRAIINQLLAQENAHLTQGRDSLYRTLLLSRGGMAALSLISLLALFLYLRQSLILNLQQNELKRLVQVEHDRLEIEVAQRTAELSELTRHLLSAREDERHRLARNLHDDLGALLTAAKLDAARIRPRLAKAAPEALELLAHLVGTLNASVALGRSIIEDLRPSALSNLGLVATLEILAREFAEQSGIEVHCTLQPVKLTASTELMIYRLVQEATTNISKYARARQVWVSLQQQGEQLEISVRDDGVGFDPDAPLRSAHGLMGMRFRVQAEGGTLTLVTAPGQGTLICARWPVGTALAAP
jgi:signal transduction histidine kinase